MAAAKVEVKGLEVLLSNLAKLPKKLAERALKAAVAEGAKPVLAAAKQKARVETGLLRKSIGVRVKQYSQPNAVAVVGPQVGKGATVTRKKGWTAGSPQYRDPARYARVLEKGAPPHAIPVGNRTVQHPGHPPKPFLGPAWQGRRVEARKAIAAELAKALHAIAASLPKK